MLHSGNTQAVVLDLDHDLPTDRRDLALEVSNARLLRVVADDAEQRVVGNLDVLLGQAVRLTLLVAAISAVLGMLALNGLPMPYHPLFNVPRFALASRDRFFLCIEAGDPLFDVAKTKEFLASIGAREVTEVEE